jgi:cell division protein FtsZ
LEKPTVIRKNKVEPRETRFGAQPKKEGNSSADLDYLDIPAFLRRQAD